MIQMKIRDIFDGKFHKLKGGAARITALLLVFPLLMQPFAGSSLAGGLTVVEAPGQEGETQQTTQSSGSGSSSDDSQDRKDLEEIADSRQKIAENKERLEELQSERGSIEDTLSALNSLKDDALSYIEELDTKMAGINAQIEEITGMMADTEEAIKATEEELARAKDTEAEQYSSMKTRIKYMYENGTAGSLDVLLDSGSFADLLNRAEYIRKVSEYDRQKLEEYKETVRYVADKEEELSEEYESLEEIAAENEKAKADIEKLQADKQAELTAYNERIDEAGAELGSMQENIAAIQAAMAAEENNIAAIEAEMKRREAEAKAKAEASGETYETISAGDISFTWPIPGASRITSEFGGREAPLEGASTSHKGVDIGAPTGTPIVAAASGTVVISTYSASAGNYIMINHGGGVYSVYMHMSSLSASVGDEVSKGQTIGLCGSTGNSTGPHLHFGIRINGSYVNPLSYVSP